MLLCAKLSDMCMVYCLIYILNELEVELNNTNFISIDVS